MHQLLCLHGDLPAEKRTRKSGAGSGFCGVRCGNRWCLLCGNHSAAASVTQNIVYTQAASEETAAAVSFGKECCRSSFCGSEYGCIRAEHNRVRTEHAAAETELIKTEHIREAERIPRDHKVNVTVSGGKITNVEIVSYQDNQQYFSRAKASVISEILSSQDVNVDAVSGATFSSHGIMEAVADALGVDYTNPNSTMQGGRMH